jgi:hypothetical protein
MLKQPEFISGQMTVRALEGAPAPPISAGRFRASGAACATGSPFGIARDAQSSRQRATSPASAPASAPPDRRGGVERPISCPFAFPDPRI